MDSQTIDLATGETGMVCCPNCGSTNLLKSELRVLTFHANCEVTLPKDCSWASFYCELLDRHRGDSEYDEGITYNDEAFTEEWTCASCSTKLGSLDDIFRRYKNGETGLVRFGG